MSDLDLADGNSSHPNIASEMSDLFQNPSSLAGSKFKLGANKVTHGGKPDAGMNGNAIIGSSSSRSRSLRLWEF